MTDEHLIEQHMLRLEHPEVDWTRHEGETSEQAIARWRVELKAKRRPRRTVAIEMLAQVIGVIQVAAAVVLILAAIGSGFAIIRALWRLAGRL
jgi:hypothetical protein